jgi:hypothetical protein
MPRTVARVVEWPLRTQKAIASALRPSVMSDCSVNALMSQAKKYWLDLISDRAELLIDRYET